MTSETGKSLIDDLRKVEVFADLLPEQLAWLADHFEELRVQPGEIFAHPGDPVDYLTVILEGEIRVERTGEPDTPIFRGFAGQVTGMLPYSRLTNYPGTGRAVLPTVYCAFTKTTFRRCCSEFLCSASDWWPSCPTVSATPPSAKLSGTS